LDRSAHQGMADKVKTSAAVSGQTTTDTDLSFKLLAALSQLLGASPHQFRSVRDFDDATGDIIKAAVVALREEDKTFLGSSLQDLIQHTVNALFGEVGKQFDHLPQEKQADVLKAVRDLISRLPQEKQADVRAKLGVNDLSDEYLRHAVVSGSLASALAGAVGIGGFGFYMGAVSLVSAMAGAVGLTLPFAFYTSLTSTIAVAANPLFFLPALVGGAALIYSRQNRSLRRKLAVGVVVQLALAGTAIETPMTAENNRKRAIAAWQHATEALSAAEDERINAERGLETAEALSAEIATAAGHDAESFKTMRGALSAARQAVDTARQVLSVRTRTAAAAKDRYWGLAL
jgi:ElaB/YqjD/DUF883 family membrane-anchored ribosome-binding protein